MSAAPLPVPRDDRVRCLEFQGELYLCKSDLFEVIRQAAAGMSNPDDQAMAENLVTWLVALTKVEP